jgi:hypothetical protein
MSLFAIDTEVTWVNGGFTYTPAGLASDLSTVLNLARENAYDTVIMPTLNIPGVITTTRETLEAQLKYGSGLEVTSTAKTGGWFVLRIGDRGPRISLCIRDWCPKDPIVGTHRSFRHMVAALLEWQHTLIEPYRMTPGVSMIAGIQGTATGARYKLQNRNTADWWKPPAMLNDLRHITRDRPDVPLHRWDMRSAYLAAAAAVDLPYQQLKHTGPHPETGAVGYYRIRIHEGPTAGLGPPDRQGCHWVGHPMLELMNRPPWSVEIIDSHTAVDYGRILRPWAERVRDQIYRTDLPDWYRAALKSGYAQAIGLLAVPRGSMYRPDWRHLIIDQMRASMVRRIASAKRLMDIDPVRVDIDSVWYDTNDPEHVGAALGEGTLMGRMRYEGIGHFTKDRGWLPNPVTV